MKSKMSTLMQNSRIISIDPGFDRIGVAIMKSGSNKPELLFSECIRTNNKDTHSKRLFMLGQRVREIIKEWEPLSMAIETLFFNSNTSSALGVAEARGVILYEALNSHLEVFEYSPQAIKIAVTGYGKADKLQMENMVTRLVKLPEKTAKRLDDEIDAIAVGITHLASQKGI